MVMLCDLEFSFLIPESPEMKKTSDVIIGEGDWRVAWNAGVEGGRDLRPTSSLIHRTRRRVVGWIGVMTVPRIPAAP